MVQAAGVVSADYTKSDDQYVAERRGEPYDPEWENLHANANGPSWRHVISKDPSRRIETIEVTLTPIDPLAAEETNLKLRWRSTAMEHASDRLAFDQYLLIGVSNSSITIELRPLVRALYTFESVYAR